MNQLQIQVFMNELAQANGKRLFERIVNVDDSIRVDYDNLIRTFRFLYGNNILITFNLKFV